MNLIDYVKWRGDILFSERRLNPVDALIFAQLSYFNFNSLVPSDFKSSITIKDLDEAVKNSADYEARCDFGALINPLTSDLLEVCAKSDRFKDIKVSCYIEKLDQKTEEQFSSLTFSFEKDWNLVAFRGTDDTIVGWKEDFNLGYLDVVPAQKDALSYLENALSSLKGKFYVAGHSKGGNLALFSSTKLSKKLKKRLECIYNFDGPGFKKSFFESEDFLEIKERVLSFVPQDSVVGMLFCHDEISVVNARDKGLMQHDPFNWRIEGAYFETLESTTKESLLVEKTVNEWFETMSREESELLVDTLFQILNDTNFKTNTELSENKLNAAIKMAKSVSKTDRKTVSELRKMIAKLFKIGMENIIPHSKE